MLLVHSCNNESTVDQLQLQPKEPLPGKVSKSSGRKQYQVAAAVVTHTAGCPQLGWQSALARDSRWPSQSQRAFALWCDTAPPACSESPEDRTSSGSGRKTHPVHQSKPAAANLSFCSAKQNVLAALEVHAGSQGIHTLCTQTVACIQIVACLETSLHQNTERRQVSWSIKSCPCVHD